MPLRRLEFELASGVGRVSRMPGSEEGAGTTDPTKGVNWDALSVNWDAWTLDWGE